MFGPLFRKELIETSRRRRYFAARVAIGASLLFILWTALPEVARNGLFFVSGSRSLAVTNGKTGRQQAAFQNWGVIAPATSTAIRSGRPLVVTTAELAAIGQRFFQTWAACVAFGIFLLAPAAVAGTIAGEKDGRTFETLLTTTLSDSEILWGKLAGRVYLLMAMMLATYPVLAIGSVFGGFDVGMIAKAGLIHLGMLALAAAVALAASATARKSYVATIRSYAILMLIWWCVPECVAWASTNASPYASMARALNPQFALSEIGADEGSIGWTTPQAIAGSTLWFATAKIHLPFERHFLLPSAFVAMAVWQFAIARRRLRLEKFWTGDPWLVRMVRSVHAGVIGGTREFVERRQNWLGFGQLWKAEVASRSIGSLDYWLGEPANPIAVRNRTSNAYDPEKFIVVLQILLWIASGGVLTYGLSSRITMSGILDFQCMLVDVVAVTIVFLAMVLAATAFARERQYESWDLLMQTGIEPREFLAGSRWGILRTLRPAMVLLAVLVLLIGMSRVETTNVVCVLIVGWLLLLIGIRLALLNSLLQKRMGAAIGTTFLAVGALVGLLALTNTTLNAAVAAIPALAFLVRRWTGRRDVALLISLLAAVYSTPVAWLEYALAAVALAVLFVWLPIDGGSRLAQWSNAVMGLASIGMLAGALAPHVYGLHVGGFEYYWRRSASSTPWDVASGLSPGLATLQESVFGLLGGFVTLQKLNWDLGRAWPALLLFVASLLLANWMLESQLRSSFDRLAGRVGGKVASRGIASSSLTP